MPGSSVSARRWSRRSGRRAPRCACAFHVWPWGWSRAYLVRGPAMLVGAVEIDDRVGGQLAAVAVDFGGRRADDCSSGLARGTRRVPRPPRRWRRLCARIARARRSDRFPRRHSPARRRSCCARRTCRRSRREPRRDTPSPGDCDARLRRQFEREQVIPVAACDQQFGAAVDLAAIVGAGQALGSAVADEQRRRGGLADAERAHVDQVALPARPLRPQVRPSSMAASSSCEFADDPGPRSGRGRRRRLAASAAPRPIQGAGRPARSASARANAVNPGRRPVCHPLAEFRPPAIRSGRFRMCQASG